MTSSRILKGAAGALAALASCASDGQTITPIAPFGPPTSGEAIAVAYGVNANGLVVVGSSTSPAGLRPFRWTPSGGIQNLGLPSGVTDAIAYAVNADGTVVVGDGPNNVASQRFRWTTAGGMTDLGPFGGSARGVSADGLAVAGTHHTGGFYRWTTTGGFQALGEYPGASQTVALGFSSDGTTIVGRSGLGVFGPTNHAVQWRTVGGWTDLGLNPGGNYAVALCASANGAFVAGEANFAFPTFIHAIRWNNTVFEDLGIPPNASTVSGLCISTDGSVVGGTIGPQAGATRAFIWTEVLGTQDLSDYLAARGVNVSNWLLYELRGISADGRTLVGWGRENFVPRAFVVRNLPPVCGPEFFEHPASTVGCVGGTVSFSVTAFGPTTALMPHFQWQKRGSDGEWNDLSNMTTTWGTTFSGVNSPTMTISNCATNDSPGLYRCFVTAGCTPWPSNAATLSLISQSAQFTGHPSDTTTCPGDSAVFVAGPPVPSTGPHTYQWERETFPNSNVFVALGGGFTYSWDGNVPGYGGIVTGQDSPVLTIAPDTGNSRILGAAHSRNYRCVVFNPCAATVGLEAGLKAFVSCIMGDMNCDGGVTVSDIGGFVLLLTNPSGYAAANPNCNPENADLNGDEQVTVSDIGAFVALLTGG